MARNLFNSVKMFRPKNNKFDLSHDVKFSLNMGELIPTLALECVPGDRFHIGSQSLLRFAPLVSPVMHRMDVTMHYFFVPNRILWPNWENYITNTKINNFPNPDALPLFPTVAFGVENYSRLYDYLGIPNPPIGMVDENISALPFAAYQKIYDDYYRDQNLIDPVFAPLSDGANNASELQILRIRSWEHDYFTSALPFAQKGDSVSIPLGEVALKPDWEEDTPHPHFEDINHDTRTGNISQKGGTGTEYINVDDSTTIANAYDPDGTLEVDATTINDLRTAFRLQEWLEKAARGGTRYIESILSHFGIRSSDKRLQRPEYIVGTKSPVVISEVLNTTGTDDNPQGNMAGHGASFTNGKYGHYTCEEHGYIIGIMSVMPKTAYQQGIPKHFIKTIDPTEFFFPSFAHLGEQPILNKELFVGTAYGNDTFGYTPRYAEYKYQSSRVAGDFRTTLDFWHEGRIFETEPLLNQEFIECVPDTRIFAVEDPDVQKLYCQLYHYITAIRPMPKFGTPQF